MIKKWGCLLILWLALAALISSFDDGRFMFYGTNTVIIPKTFVCTRALIFSPTCEHRRSLHGQGHSHSGGGGGNSGSHSGDHSGDHSSSHSSSHSGGVISTRRMAGVNVVMAGAYLTVYNSNSEWDFTHLHISVDLFKCEDIPVRNNTVRYTQPYICLCSHDETDFLDGLWYVFLGIIILFGIVGIVFILYNYLCCCCNATFAKVNSNEKASNTELV